MMSAVWEPISFSVGDRVRVLARPECFYCREDHDAEVGATGVVTRLKTPEYLLGSGEPGEAAHYVWVEFDDPRIVDRTVAKTDESHFAAVELELLDSPPPAPRPADGIEP